MSEQPERKHEFRNSMRKRRRELSVADRVEQSAALTDAMVRWYDSRRERGLAPHGRVASTLSYGVEPDVAAANRRFHEAGVEVLVPVSLPGRQLGWVRWHPEVETQRSAVAPIEEPVGDRADASTMSSVDAIFVPAQAVDAQGYRMGQGGGYYDRFLSHLIQLGVHAKPCGAEPTTTPVTLATVFSHEFFSGMSPIPVGPYDQPVQGVLTPQVLYWV